MFLATTALSEFWEKDQEILFLGSWCIRYDRRTEWGGLKYQVMPCLWDDRRQFYNAARYLDECGERMLSHLTDYLNSVHGVSHSQRYWRILVGPWLLHYLHAVYDRYVYLAEAFSKYSGLQSVVLDPRSFRMPKDTQELVDFVCHDPYNLQIYSQLLSAMGFTFPSRILQGTWLETEKGNDNKKWNGVAKKAAKGGLRFARRALSRFRGRMWQVGLNDLDFSTLKMYALAWQTNFRMLPYEMQDESLCTIGEPVFDERRKDLWSLPSSNEFERIFAQSLPQNFPALYLEAFRDVREKVLSETQKIPAVIASSVGWYFNEPFKFLAAEASERGSRLVTRQHGGGYGIFRFSAPELHETRVGNSFMAWGWADKEKESLRNLPSPKLSSLAVTRLKEPRSHKHATILFVSTEHPRYLYRFHSMPVGSQWEGYFEWELRFLSTLPSLLHATILFRTNPNVFGQAIRQRISEKFAEVQWDDSRLFYQRLNSIRLAVIDNCATTFLETLAANVPTLLFWDPQRWEVREEAAPYFDSLRKVGILWDSPEAAAKKVAEIYDEPWSWWGSEAVQEVRRRFVDRYALAREDWVDYWVKALEEEIALAQVPEKSG